LEAGNVSCLRCVLINKDMIVIDKEGIGYA